MPVKRIESRNWEGKAIMVQDARVLLRKRTRCARKLRFLTGARLVFLNHIYAFVIVEDAPKTTKWKCIPNIKETTCILCMCLAHQAPCWQDNAEDSNTRSYFSLLLAFSDSSWHDGPHWLTRLKTPLTKECSVFQTAGYGLTLGLWCRL